MRTQWAWVYLRDDRGARLITGDIDWLLERATPASADTAPGRRTGVATGSPPPWDRS